jgi:hypothetical protein
VEQALTIIHVNTDIAFPMTAKEFDEALLKGVKEIQNQERADLAAGQKTLLEDRYALELKHGQESMDLGERLEKFKGERVDRDQDKPQQVKDANMKLFEDIAERESDRMAERHAAERQAERERAGRNSEERKQPGPEIRF